MENTENNNKENARDPMKIEINKYGHLIKALDDNRKVAKAVVFVSIVLILVIVGLSLIAMTVKRFYPYNTIGTNVYGATIIENEDKEVIYWLFNTADLWANTGIEVQEGDVITVRASGAYHTAIHHLIADADRNNELQEDWISPLGGKSPSKKDEARADFRIAKDADWGEILMQVIPSKESDKIKKDGKFDPTYANYLDGGKTDKEVKPDIYIIGTEKRDIRIRQSGILHFAVNDIVLTITNIEKMQKLVKFRKYKDNNRKEIFLDAGKLSMGLSPTENNKKFKDRFNNTRDSISNDYKSVFIKGTKYKLDIPTKQETPQDELSYYKKNNFVDAWFVDNAGSLLIAIERKKHK